MPLEVLTSIWTHAIGIYWCFAFDRDFWCMRIGECALLDLDA